MLVKVVVFFIYIYLLIDYEHGSFHLQKSFIPLYLNNLESEI